MSNISACIEIMPQEQGAKPNGFAPFRFLLVSAAGDTAQW
jgi:hypothetical protein